MVSCNVKEVALNVWKEMFRENPQQNHDRVWLVEFAERVVARVDAVRQIGK